MKVMILLLVLQRNLSISSKKVSNLCHNKLAFLRIKVPILMTEDVTAAISLDS